MRQYLRKIVSVLFFFAVFMAGAKTVEAATRIHYIGLLGSTDAILLESDGHFGMVDSGEDWDYPDGKNPLYPLRGNTVTDHGYDEQVIYYMKSVGVTTSNLDFYIGTHAHSDHIGTGDDIVTHFKPKTLYLKKYSDKNITNKTRLWDNQYIYDGLINAAKKAKVKCVQDIKEGTTIKLGQMTLQLYNTKVRTKIDDDNENSIIVKVKAYQTTTLLTGDAVPYVMDELLAAGKIGYADILKLPHHGYEYNNPGRLMKAIRPNTAIVTGGLGNLSRDTSQTLAAMNTNVKSTNSSAAALVTDYFQIGHTTAYKMINAGWMKYNKNWYYLQSDGRSVRGWNKISNKWYYFGFRAQMQTGWVSDKKKLYYMAPAGMKGKTEGEMVTGWVSSSNKNFYFKDKSGEMLTGWQTIKGKQYYLKKSGATRTKGQALTRWQTIGGKTFYFKATGGKGTKGSLLTGWHSIGGKNYFFDSQGSLGKKGIMKTGWFKNKGKQFYLKKSGKNGDKGQALLGFQKIGNQRYYFKKTGAAGAKGGMLTGWQTSDGIMYHFSSKGYLADVQWDGTYLNGSKTGTKSINEYNQAKAGNKTLKNVAFKLKSAPAMGDITYETYSAQGGWEKARKNGQTSGSGSNEIQAIKIKLEQELAKKVDVYYRVHLSGYGWLDWAKNGAAAGTIKGVYGITNIQVQLRPKTSPLKSKIAKPFLDVKVDKQKLQALVNQVKQMDSEQYTENSWRQVKQSLTAAEAVLKKDCTQLQANEAQKKLQESIKALVKRPTETPTPTVTPTETPIPSQMEIPTPEELTPTPPLAPEDEGEDTEIEVPVDPTPEPSVTPSPPEDPTPEEITPEETTPDEAESTEVEVKKEPEKSEEL